MEAGGWTAGVLGFCVRVVISLINQSRETTKTQRRDSTKGSPGLEKIREIGTVFEGVYFICW